MVKKIEIRKLLYHRKYKQREVDGQKKTNLINVFCEHHPTLKDDVTFCALRIAFFLSNFHNGPKGSLKLHSRNYVFYIASQFKLSWLGTHKLNIRYRSIIFPEIPHQIVACWCSDFFTSTHNLKKIFLTVLTFTISWFVKSMRKIFSNFVCISESPNFMRLRKDFDPIVKFHIWIGNEELEKINLT